MLNSDTQKNTKLMKLALFVGILLMLLKFWAWYLTSSSAILSDAFESVINVLAGAFALFSLYYASRPRDKDHPYGHGKIEYLSAGFEGGLVLLAGLAIISKAILNWTHKLQLNNLDYGVWITVVSGLVNYFLGKYLVKAGRNTHSDALVADGKHLLTDTWTSLGLVLGLLVMYLTNIFWLDSLIAILFALIILRTGYQLVNNAINNLMDEADVQTINKLATALSANRREKWIDIHNLRVLKYGSALHVDCHITLPWYDNLEQTHEEVNKLEQLIKQQMGNNIEFFIHADPCLPQSCKICALKDCTFRKYAFEIAMEWNLATLLPNEKHKK